VIEGKCKCGMNTVMFKHQELKLPGERLRHRGCRKKSFPCLESTFQAQQDEKGQFPALCSLVLCTAYKNRLPHIHTHAQSTMPAHARAVHQEMQYEDGNLVGIAMLLITDRMRQSYATATLPPSEQVIEQIQTTVLTAHAEFFLRANAEYTARIISFTSSRRHHCGRQG
jgi:hypothetical protein